MAKQKAHTAFETFLEGAGKCLRIIRRVCREIVRLIGLVLIDQLMRKVVRWYDRRYRQSAPTPRQPADSPCAPTHPNPNRTQAAGWQQEKKSFEELVASNRNTIGKLQAENRRLKHQNYDLIRKYRTYQKKEEKAGTLTNDLQTELSELRKRAMAPEYIPGTILYAEADATSGNLRKANVHLQPTSLFEIHTSPGDLTKGEFIVLNPTQVATIIQNRNITLKACRIEEISAQANHIQTVTKGKVNKNGKDWQVVQPAVVRLVNR